MSLKNKFSNMKFVQVPLINGKKPKIVLAYSGGLDTSTILKWLILKGYDVITFTADIGQIDDDLKKIELKAKKMGAIATYSIDVKKEFVTDYIFTVFKTGAKYENSYLLGTSIARPLIAKKQIEIALKEGAQFVSHGCTGKGNDQVRFELSYLALNPNIKIFVP
jgi:argininosuccinate synthase